jgi:hypothetical protein
VECRRGVAAEPSGMTPAKSASVPAAAMLGPHRKRRNNQSKRDCGEAFHGNILRPIRLSGPQI